MRLLLVLLFIGCWVAAKPAQQSSTFVRFNQATKSKQVQHLFQDEVVATPKSQHNGEVVWSRHSDFGIYESCEISAASKRVIAGTTDVYTPTNPDDAELVPFENGKRPDFVWTGPNVQVAAQRNGNVVAAVSFDDQDINLKLAKWTAGSGKSTPDWSVDIAKSFPVETTLAISKDGKKIAVLTSLLEFMNPNNTRLYFFDATTSKLEQVVEHVFGARHLVMSADGGLIAFHANASIYVYNTQSKRFVWAEDVGYSDFNLAMSDDGQWLVAGFLSLDVYKWNGQTYVPQWSSTLPEHYVETSAIANGNIVAAWSSFDAEQPVVQAYSLSKGSTPVWTYEYAVSTDLQDTPWSASITDDGKFAVVGTWGNLTDTNPEVRVWAMDSQQPIYTLKTSGSVFAVDIAQDVSNPKTLHITAGCKATHANTMGRGGDLYYSVHHVQLD
jgi:hypothetical protein